MVNPIQDLFDTSGFPARWNCGQWSEPLGWTHVAADVATFAAYTTIPIVLACFIRRRRDLPFPKVFWLFCAFIFACGTVHLIEATIFWWPAYRLSAAIKVVMAVVSWATVIALIPILPRALSLPGLAKVNERLEAQVRDHERTKRQLERTNAELTRFHDLAVGREMRIVELKRQVNQMAHRAGQAAVYDLEFAEAAPGAATSAGSVGT